MLIKNAIIFTPDDTTEGDLRITNQYISDIQEELTPEPDETVIDIDGAWLWPGAIDAHVHFRDPGITYKEDWETGSMAAVSGGVTTVFDMPNTKPVTTTAQALHEKKAIAAKKSYCNYGLFFGATTDNIQEANQVVQEVPGMKVFMGCSTGNMLVSKREDLQVIFKEFKGLINVHAESEARLHLLADTYKDQLEDPSIHSVIRDPETARLAVELACELAYTYQARLHVAHLSTAVELQEIAKWKEKWLAKYKEPARITCEVCPHHLFLDTKDYDTYDSFVRMNPPLRDTNDVNAMWEGLQNKQIQIIATDHAPHTIEEKSRPYKDAPSGVPGVETLLPIMLNAAYHKDCTYQQVLEWLCHGPAKTFNIQKRGTIQVGNFADLTVINPDLTRTVLNEDQFTRCQWSPWDGQSLTGWPTHTFVNGKLVFQRNGDNRGQHFFHEKNAQDVYTL